MCPPQAVESTVGTALPAHAGLDNGHLVCARPVRPGLFPAHLVRGTGVKS